MGTLEQSVWEISGHAEDVTEANSLLGALAQQRALLAESQAFLAETQSYVQEVRQMRQAVADHADVDDAMAHVSQLVALKDMLLSNADRADQAAAVLAITEDLQHRMANAMESSELALAASKNLLKLQSEILAGSIDVAPARKTIDEWRSLGALLERESVEVEVARDHVTDLISLKDQVVSRTQDLDGAIETLALTREVGHQFLDAATTLEHMRHWMLEISAAEPLLQNVVTSIQPILQMGRLESMAPEALRAVAREVVGQQPRVAHRVLGDDAVAEADE